MNKIVSISIVLLVFASMFCAVALNNVSVGENYIDNSYENADGPGVDPDITPDNYQQRDEPRTRNKDA